jgi:hypothetical protein
MAQPLADHERYQLLSVWCDGSFSDGQLEQLDDLLRTDAEFRSFYLEYMDQHAVLAAGALPIGDFLLTDRRPRSVRHEPAGDGEATEAGFGDVVGTGLVGLSRRTQVSWRWRAAAALLLVGLTVLTARLWPTGRREAPVVAGPPPGGAPPRLAPADGFAVVIELDRALWEPGDGRKPSEGDILAASRLVLRSGRITLALLSGVTLTTEGPADLDIRAIDRVHCRRGKLRTRVPAGAEGFIVSTPGTAVVDLGTEIGLNVASDGKAQVMVFEGEAEAAVLNLSGSPLRSQQVEKHHAVELDPQIGQIEEAAARPEDFVTPSVLAVPPLALDPSYKSAVLEAQPWGYWRFEAINGGASANEVVGRPPLRATGPVHLAVAGDQNRCAEFRAGENEQYFEMDGLWEPPQVPGYAVELWSTFGQECPEGEIPCDDVALP